MSTTVYIEYEPHGAINRAWLVDEKGVRHDLVDMLRITGIGFSYKEGRYPQVTLTFDAVLKQMK